jgi:hypothetical protein
LAPDTAPTRSGTPDAPIRPSEAKQFSPQKEGKTMKSMTTQLMMTAAALAIATAVAPAQTFKAEIPFAFQAGGKTMAPGTYLVRADYAKSKMVTFANSDSRKSMMVLSGPATDPAKAWTAKGDPVLSFECGVGRCALARLWTGSVEPVMTFPHPAPGRNEHASYTEIRLTKTNGD